MSRKKILLIAYNFPPFISSQAQRTYYLALGLSHHADVTVLCSTSDPSGEKDVDMELSRLGIKVIRVKQGFLHRVKVRNKKETQKTFSEGNTKTFLRVKHVLRGLAIPDGVVDWIPTVLSSVKKREFASQYDILFSTATPYTDHILTILLRLFFFRKSVLILDYGDPWVREHSRKRNIIRKVIERKLEAYILSKSSKIIFTTKATRELYKEDYLLDDDKMSVLYMGHAMEELTKERFSQSDDRIVLRYFGSVQTVHRNPTPFLQAVEKLVMMNATLLDQLIIEFYLIPHVDNFIVYDLIEQSIILKKICNMLKPVSYSKMAELAKESYCNILFGNTSNFQVPGKVFDYIGAGRPIFYIKNNNSTDEVDNLLGTLPWTIRCQSNDTESILEGLRKLLATENPDFQQAFTMAKAASWEARGQEIASILRGLI